MLAFRAGKERGKKGQLASRDACSEAEVKLEDTINALAASVAELKHAARSKRAIQIDDHGGNITVTAVAASNNDDAALPALSSPSKA